MAHHRKRSKQPPPEFVKELAEWLGRTIIAASQLEHTLGLAVADLLHLSRLQHRSFVIPMSTSTKVTLLRQLGKQYLSATDRKDLRAMLKEIESCVDLRNELVHGFYGARYGKFALITHSGEGRFSQQIVLWDPEALKKLASRLVAAAKFVVPDIRRRFRVRLSLPKKRQSTAASV